MQPGNSHFREGTIGLYMRVHIIQRYDDTMKEKGEEEGERKERDIYI